METFIKRHNNKILKRHDNQEKPSYTKNTRLCNCRNPEQCPVKGICLQTSILYKARITTTDNNETKTYIGITGNNFKTRYRNHCKSLNKKYLNETKLSKHICNLKDNKCKYTTAWDIIKEIPCKAGSRKCRLCLEEKLFILKRQGKNILNRWSELFSKCRHVTKHFL